MSLFWDIWILNVQWMLNYTFSEQISNAYEQGRMNMAGKQVNFPCKLFSELLCRFINLRFWLFKAFHSAPFTLNGVSYIPTLRKKKKPPEGFFHYFSLTTAPVAVDVTFRLIKRLSFTLSSSISVTLRFCYSVNMSVVVATRPVVMNDCYQVTNPNSQSSFEGQAEVSRDDLCKMLWVVVTVIVSCLWFYCTEAIKVSNSKSNWQTEF